MDEADEGLTVLAVRAALDAEGRYGETIAVADLDVLSPQVGDEVGW